jgi:zinc transporter ZupT
MPTKDPDVGIAFALVTGAGMATALGAAIVFSPTLVKYASRRTLAGALGLSAGVMTYVSFAEIFAKSRLSFIDAGHSEDDAYIYATLCFFGGVLLMIVSILYFILHTAYCTLRSTANGLLYFMVFSKRAIDILSRVPHFSTAPQPQYLYRYLTLS